MARVWIDRSAPRTLVELTLAGSTTGYFASAPVNTLAQPYLGRLVEEPTVRRQLVDVFWGPVEVQDVEIAIANLDSRFTAEYVADLRGHACTIRRYDETYGVSVTEWVGQVERASMTGDGRLEITGTNVNLAVFDEKIPWPTVETSTFPLALDVGMTIPVVFGNVPKVLLPYVCHDRVTPKFQYTLWGPVTFAQLWRDGPNDSLTAIGTGEYTVSNALYSGLTTVQFLVEQVNFQGAPHRIYADVVGYAAERDFVRAVQRLLNDPLWGLAQPIDTASFNAASTALTAATGGLLCDVALTEASEAKNYLRQALMVRGMRLGITALGQWQITVDTAPGAPVLALGDGMGPGPRNVLNVGRRTRVPASDRPASLTLHYRYDLMTDGFLFTADRVLDTQGRSIDEENVFIRDHLTADKVADYLGKRRFYGQQTVENVEITPAARTLVEGQLVTLTYPTLGYTNATFEVREVAKGLDRITATLAEYSAAIHTYTPGTLPTDNITGTFTDLTRTAPDAPTGVSIGEWTTEQSSDGTITATVLIYFTATSANVTAVTIDYDRNGEAFSASGVVTQPVTPGVSSAVRIKWLIPGVTYNFRVRAVSSMGLTSPSTVLAPGPTPGDITAPPIPGLVGAMVANRAVHVQCVASGSDLAALEWEIRTAAAGGGSAMATGSHTGVKDTSTWNTWTVTLGAILGYGTTYHIRVRAIDATGNRSDWSASVPFTYTTQATSDITPNAVSQWIGGAATNSTVPADGNWYLIASVTLAGILSGSILQGSAQVIIRNDSTGSGNFWFRVRNITTGALAPELLSTIAPAFFATMSTAMFDPAPGAGSVQIGIDIRGAPGPPNVPYFNAWLQVSEIRR